MGGRGSAGSGGSGKGSSGALGSNASPYPAGSLSDKYFQKGMFANAKFFSGPAGGGSSSGGSSSGGNKGTAGAGTGGIQGGGGSGAGSSSSSLDFSGWTAGQKKIYKNLLSNGDGVAAKDWYEAVTKSIKSNTPTPTPLPAPGSTASGVYTPTFDTTTVALQPGTTHTPLLPQSPLAATLGLAVPDITAPLGSSDNPHVFQKWNAGTSNTTDWQTFGAMHTNQDKAGWDTKVNYDTARKYTETTAPYNRLAAGKETKDTKALDKAFKDSAVRETEEWVVVSSSQDAKFFTGANGTLIPDGSGHTNPFQASDIMYSPEARQLQDLSGLIGQTFVQTNYVSAAVPVDKEFGFSNNIRVLFRLPPGSKGIYVSGNPGHKGTPISYFNEGEMEMVLPRHQTLKVISVVPTTKTGGGYTIDVVVEVVNQPYV